MNRTEEQEQAADVGPDFPYKQYMNHPAWKVLEQALAELVENQDLELQTADRYVVGYLIKSMVEAQLLPLEVKTTSKPKSPRFPAAAPPRDRPPLSMKHRKDPAASRRYHNRVARQYDSIYEDSYWEFHDRLTWNAIKPHLPRDLAARCCDLGCGTGKWGLKLLKTGLATTFVDHSPAMIERTRENLSANSSKATLVVADIVGMPELADGAFELVLAMGDPISICSDPAAAAREMFRICAPGGVVIATADNKLAALDHLLSQGDRGGPGAMEELEAFVKTSRTKWLTAEKAEQFELTTFTPGGLRKLFEKAGFEVVSLIGKTILPLRQHRQWLENGGDTTRLLRLEEELAADPTAAARAGHLQITVRRGAKEETAAKAAG